MTVKLNQAEWARLIEQRLKKYELQQAIQRKHKWQHLKKYVSIPIIIGVSCIWIYLALFDWEWMVKGVLNAVISATLVAAFLTIVNTR